MGSKTKIFLVLEFVKGGELFDKIVNHGRLREDEARKYFQQLINAVDYCHSRGVYHRDLKPENLLLDEYGNLKVSDFGLSALSLQIRFAGLLLLQVFYGYFLGSGYYKKRIQPSASLLLQEASVLVSRGAGYFL